MEIKIGQGYDLHVLEKGNPFILGNIRIPHHSGFVAHSDGDVLIHAIIDALLGALCLGDIGRMFPDTDPQYKNADSAELLKKTISKVSETGFSINNLDTTIICQSPKLKPFIPQIQKRLSEILKTAPDNISIKAKTKEKVDAVGQEKAVEAIAICLLLKK
ncbi:MAG: 2-C-methyl-D-erythritol 2,4-cyclodiphosphate synthase [Spirochaetes bacterium]|nr:2-C-methyl-D-erythritol 2,4-cyclodiphosphate synthase [Spirochaetota bacterium]